MGLDRADRQIQLLGDLAVRMAERDQSQHIDLALGQVVGRAGGRLAGDAGAERRVEVRLVRGGAADRLDKLAVGRLLEHVAERARGERLAREGRLGLHRQHDDLGIGHLGAQRRDRVEARLARHVEVKHEHVGLMAADVAPRGVDVTRLGDDLESVLALQQQPQPAAHDGVVVGEDDADARRRVCHRR